MWCDKKKCNKCTVYKCVSEFYKQKNGHMGLTGECKECRRERSRVYGAENKEKKNAVARSKKVDRREYNAQFRKDNPTYFQDRRLRLKES